jgi:ADP-ribosylglycohydrolase
MKNIIIGMAVGDALGVPHEFKPKFTMDMYPATDMIGGGTHGQLKGTWSDDTSMALCLIDSLCNGLNYTDIANKFSGWLYDCEWTPHGEVFDHGLSTKSAIDRWRVGATFATECGGLGNASNGNGSVMRTLVLVPYIEAYRADIRYNTVSNVSSITHGHWISKYSCYLVCEYVIALRTGLGKTEAFTAAVDLLEDIRELDILLGDITQDDYDEVFGWLIESIINGKATDENFKGSGYARDTAITSIWCLLTTESYKEATLKAVNYGDDTDTTGCVTGGLAGILYGVDGIPSDWVDSIARKDDILELVNKYEATYEVV